MCEHARKDQLTFKGSTAQNIGSVVNTVAMFRLRNQAFHAHTHSWKNAHRRPTGVQNSAKTFVHRSWGSEAHTRHVLGCEAASFWYSRRQDDAHVDCYSVAAARAQSHRSLSQYAAHEGARHRALTAR